MKTLLAVALLLALPAAAHAGAPVVPPLGASVCAADGICMTLEATDAVKLSRTDNLAMSLTGPPGPVQTPAGAITWDRAPCTSIVKPWAPPVAGACTEISCTLGEWELSRFHAYRTSEPYLRATVRRCYPARDDLPVIPAAAPDYLEHRLQFDTPDCNPTGDNEGWVVPWGPGPHGFAAAQSAPDEFAIACALPRIGTTAGEGTSGTPPTPAPPAKAETCAPIVVAKKHVAVTSVGQACFGARNILAKFMRTGAEPAGWVCSRLAVGHARVASCGTPSKAAKKIVGRWRA